MGLCKGLPKIPLKNMQASSLYVQYSELMEVFMATLMSAMDDAMQRNRKDYDDLVAIAGRKEVDWDQQRVLKLADEIRAYGDGLSDAMALIKKFIG